MFHILYEVPMRLFRILVALAAVLPTVLFASAARETFEANMLSKSYHAVPFPLDNTYITAVISDTFYPFLASEECSHIYFKLDEDSRRSDLGYVLRESRNTHFDDKVYFHYHPAIWEQYKGWIDEHPITKRFLEHAHRIWLAAGETIEGPLAHLNYRYPGLAMQFLGQAPEKRKYLIRFLRYSPKEVKGDILAKAHFDAGCMTLAIAESTPGLRIGRDQESLREVAHRDRQALFFLSSTFQAQVEATYFHPGWHDVIRKSDDNTPRWAVVAFFEAPDVAAPSWEATHQSPELNAASASAATAASATTAASADADAAAF
jgi:hypothetical protein